MPPAMIPSPGRRGDTTVAAVARLDLHSHLNQCGMTVQYAEPMWDDCTIGRANEADSHDRCISYISTGGVQSMFPKLTSSSCQRGREKGMGTDVNGTSVHLMLPTSAGCGRPCLGNKPHLFSSSCT